MSNEEGKEVPVMTFSGVLPFEIVQEETDEGSITRVYRGAGRNKKLWALFVNDQPSAIISTYNTYSSILARVLNDAKGKIENPEKAAELAENKAKPVKATSPDAIPLFAKPKNIVN